ncbi:MAG: RES family NAD+ phosphorylase [Deltaproteobacteria bacterium]|nr:RES family NAD+ phosphorylase [Deltaproteobacteria bacterium]
MKFGEPPPPHVLGQTPAIFRILPAGATVWRIYFRGGGHPTLWSGFRFYGPTDSRFDHHLPDVQGHGYFQSRGIMYGAFDLVTCLAEVFQQKRAVHRVRGAPWLVSFQLSAPLHLLDLTSVWPTQTGKASAAINTRTRSRARRWSRAIYEAYPGVQGLYYASSMHALRPCVALYERAVPSIPAFPGAFHRSLADPTWHRVLRNIADDLGYALL